jgi:hypothetical protein
VVNQDVGKKREREKDKEGEKASSSVLLPFLSFSVMESVTIDTFSRVFSFNRETKMEFWPSIFYCP